FDAVIDSLEFDGIADLGCGAAARLIDIAARRPGTRGVGVDIDGPTVSYAREAVAAAGLSDRIGVVQGDPTKVTGPVSGVEVVFSVFMAHDLWPRARAIDVLRSLTNVFPDLTDLVLCDTHRSEVPEGERLPMFSMGFELVHALKGEYVPSESEWSDVFSAAG